MMCLSFFLRFDVNPLSQPTSKHTTSTHPHTPCSKLFLFLVHSFNPRGAGSDSLRWWEEEVDRKRCIHGTSIVGVMFRRTFCDLFLLFG